MDETPTFEQIPNGSYFTAANESARELARAYGNGRSVSRLGLEAIGADGHDVRVIYFVPKKARAVLEGG